MAIKLILRGIFIALLGAMRKAPFLFVTLLLNFGLAAGANDFAPPKPCVELFEAAPMIKLRDSSIETEMEVSPELMSYITTESGLVRDVIEKGGFSSAGSDRVGLSHVNETDLWDQLSLTDQILILRHQSKRRTKSFYQQTRIKGLKFKDEIPLQLTKPLHFLGEVYPAGNVTFPLGKYLKNIEHCGPDTMKFISCIEFHFRSEHSAKENLSSLNQLIEALDLPPSPQHIHLVGPNPNIGKNDSQKIKQTARATNFWRETNLLSELYETYFYDHEVWKLSAGMDLGFKYVKPEEINQVHKFYITNRDDKKVERDHFTNDWRTIAYVSLRGGSKYGDPNLSGLEWRTIAPDQDMDSLSDLIQAVQTRWLNKDYGDIEEFAAWEQSTNGSLSQVHYNQEWKKLRKNIPEHIKKWKADNFSLIGNRALRALKHYGVKRTQFKMMVFDWSNDVMFFDNPEAIERIEEAQIHALNRVQNEIFLEDEDSLRKLRLIYREFIRESGIFATLLDRFGIHMEGLRNSIWNEYASQVSEFIQPLFADDSESNFKLLDECIQILLDRENMPYPFQARGPWDESYTVNLKSGVLSLEDETTRYLIDVEKFDPKKPIISIFKNGEFIVKIELNANGNFKIIQDSSYDYRPRALISSLNNFPDAIRLLNHFLKNFLGL